MTLTSQLLAGIDLELSIKLVKVYMPLIDEIGIIFKECIRFRIVSWLNGEINDNSKTILVL